MDKSEGVPQFMFHLFDEPSLQKVSVWRQAIELLLQPGKGDKPYISIQLGLTEDKGQDRDEEIGGGDADHL